MTLFSIPNQISGDIPIGSDMVNWAHSFIVTTGRVLSQFYKYQYYEMAPTYIHHRDHFAHAAADLNLYARFTSTTPITEAYIRMVLSHFA
jgi:hypothetical protein